MPADSALSVLETLPALQSLPGLKGTLTPLLAAAPEINGAYVLGIVARVLHIASAIILLGGVFYLKTVLAPAGADACFAERRGVWAKWVGMTSGFLLLSGFYNFYVAITTAKAAGDKLPSAYHMLFGVKFLLALAVMFLAAIVAGKTDAAERFRQQIGKWLNIAWAAGLSIVVIGAILRSLH
ncbi:MAG: hypothetical protein AAGA92_02240 [Planctomycetota bacterium]